MGETCNDYESEINTLYTNLQQGSIMCGCSKKNIISSSFPGFNASGSYATYKEWITELYQNNIVHNTNTLCVITIWQKEQYPIPDNPFPVNSIGFAIAGSSGMLDYEWEYRVLYFPFDDSGKVFNAKIEADH